MWTCSLGRYSVCENDGTSLQTLPVRIMNKFLVTTPSHGFLGFMPCSNVIGYESFRGLCHLHEESQM
jgi:hypothetical protein